MTLPTPPAVYFAGPIDYIEHRSPGNHVRDNWRHRFFDDLLIEVLCPTCMNINSGTTREIMKRNAGAMARAEFFVGYFPGDAATFGTPIETWQWAEGAFRAQRDPGVLIHPARPGVFVQHLMDMFDLHVVRTFEEARSWLRRQLL